METQTYELMCDVNGDPIEVSAAARFVRLRKVLARGASVLVLGPDKRPVRLGIEAAIADAHDAVNNEPGEYRVWPLDAAGRPIKGATPGVFIIAESANNAPGAVAQKEMASAMAALAEALREANATTRDLAKTTSEMANKVITNYASTLEAGATVIRAAHGAGITERNEPELGDASEDDDDQPPMTYVEQAVKGACESVMTVASLKVEEMKAAKQAREQKPAPQTTAHNIQPHATRPATPPGGASAPSKPRAEAPKAPRPTPPKAPPTASEPPKEPAAPRNASGIPTQQEAMHLITIKSGLKPNECRFVEKSIANMSTEERTQWIEDLCSRSVDDAIALVRSVIENVKNQKGDAL